ncbi:MAG: alpha/beta hydrolase [Leptospirales bacterium]|nr:alpha/beta hydrolase [Leptospirales bacterium]
MWNWVWSAIRLGQTFLFLSFLSNCTYRGNTVNPLDSKQVASRVYYPAQTERNTPVGAKDFDIPVTGDDTVGARYYRKDPAFRTVLYFHGNGETVPDYDDIAPMFHAVGMNLFVVDYRGYGWSTGFPTLRHLSIDPPRIAEFFLNNVEPSPLKKPLVFGRSLGSSPATDVAIRFPERFAGLVLESGFADVTPLLRLLGIDLNAEQEAEADKMFSNSIKLRGIKIPVLILHGERDMLIQVTHAQENFASLEGNPIRNSSKLKTFPGAGHNDMIARDRKGYFKAIQDFAGDRP